MECSWYESTGKGRLFVVELKGLQLGEKTERRRKHGFLKIFSKPIIARLPIQ